MTRMGTSADATSEPRRKASSRGNSALLDVLRSCPLFCFCSCVCSCSASAPPFGPFSVVFCSCFCSVCLARNPLRGSPPKNISVSDSASVVNALIHAACASLSVSNRASIHAACASSAGDGRAWHVVSAGVEEVWSAVTALIHAACASSAGDGRACVSFACCCGGVLGNLDGGGIVRGGWASAGPSLYAQAR